MTHKLSVADKLSGQPEERLLKVVVGLGRDVVVLEVLLAVESDGLGLDLALLHIDLVAGENNGDVFANADEVAWISEISHRFETFLLHLFKGVKCAYGASWGRSCR